MFRPKTFSETIRPILLLNILFGTGSFVLSKEQKVRKIVEGVYMVIAWISFNYVFYMQHIYMQALAPTKINLNMLMTKMWCGIEYEVATVLIFITKFKMKITQDLIKTIDEIDQKMQTIGLPSQYPIEYKHQLYHLGWLLVHVMVIFVVTWIFKIKPSTPIVNKIALTIGVNMIQIMLMIVQLSFALWIGNIRTKFRQLNNLLKEMIETLDHSGPKRFLEINVSEAQKRRRPNVHVFKGNLEIIKKAKEYHLDLIIIARQINNFYGMQLLLTIFVWLLTIVTLLYMVNYCIWHPLLTVEIFDELLPVVIWLMIIMSKMIHFQSNCMEITNEAGKAGFLLCRLYNTSTSIEFRAEVQNFTHQVVANPLVFTVCRLVDIDRTFISSVVGSIFAYLVVIIQLAYPQAQNRFNLAANETDVNATVTYT